MKKRDRVKKAVLHHQTDIIPYNIELTTEELEKVARFVRIEKNNFWDWAGNHIEKVSYNIGGSYIKPGFFKDEFGVVWNRSGLDKDIGIVEEFKFKGPRIADYVFPEPDTEEIKRVTDRSLSNGRDSFKFGKIGLAYFERAWSLRGMENLLTDFLLESAFVEELFEKILEYNLKIIDTVLDYDLDGFYFGDDYGQQTGLIMSPGTWRKFIKPGLAKMFQKVKGAGKFVALHSCGNIIDLFGDLIDIGLDIYQTFQPEIYDMKQVKAKYGSHLTFYGGISTQRTLPFVKPEELKRIVKKTIDIMSQNGGYIAAPTHQVPVDVPAENIVALVEVLKDQQSKW